MSKHDDSLDALLYATKVIKDNFKNWEPLTLKPNEKSYEYYKGFYDATHQFMQTFERLIEVGAFSGTKINSNN